MLSPTFAFGTAITICSGSVRSGFTCYISKWTLQEVWDPAVVDNQAVVVYIHLRQQPVSVLLPLVFTGDGHAQR
jgi:hypothetical protein